jgi:hypothetical protein
MTICRAFGKEDSTNMSRSYKKTPCMKDKDRFMQKYANRRIRQIPPAVSIANGSSYRKNTNPWDISDWWYSKTYAEYEHDRDRYEDSLVRRGWDYQSDKYLRSMTYRRWYRMYKGK